LAVVEEAGGGGGRARVLSRKTKPRRFDFVEDKTKEKPKTKNAGEGDRRGKGG
jgi:hypothetical protein